MMKTYRIAVSQPGASERYPYVYILYTVNPEAFVYVGETEDLNGAIGRLAGHIKLNNPGTFIKKFMENSNYDVSCLKDIHMIAFDISEHEIFTGEINKTRRRALEYLLHFKILGFSCDDSVKIPYTVVSHVQTQERFISDRKINDICNEIFKEAIQLLPYSEECQ